MNEQIRNFFYPKTVCLIGASSKEKSIGYEILNSIKKFGYKGKVFPVNPNAEEILGFKCYKNVEALNEKIDLAIIAVKKQLVEESIDILLSKKVQSIILITAGFRETGEEGEKHEKQILEKIKNSGARLVGPNCMGAINALEEIKLNATFVAERPVAGKIAFLSQSGGLGAAVLNTLRETDICFAHFISVGNKADVNEIDLLKFWGADSNIKTIAFYLESFINGREFIEAMSDGKISKPIIILKAGRGKSGMRAAMSHTGALGGSDKTIDAVLKQFGVIRVETISEMFNLAKAFENFSIPNWKRIAVLTNAGGPAILAVDAVEKENLELAELSLATKQKLKEFIHPEGSVENPVDLLPNGSAEDYKRAVEILSSDINVDAIISIFVEPIMVKPFDIAEAVNSVDAKRKPVFQVVMPLPEFWEFYKNNSSDKKPIFRNPEDPAKVISGMLAFQETKEKYSDPKNIRLIKRTARFIDSDSNGWLSQEKIDPLLKEYKIPAVENYFFEPKNAASVNIHKFPVVLKAIGKNVIHKTELNAVKLNIRNSIELRSAIEELTFNLNKRDIPVEKFQIQPYVKPKHEILLGGYRDSSFGPIIAFGTGGKYVETYNDVSLKSAYLNEDDIEDLIDSTKMGEILKGTRGEFPADLTKLKSVIKNTAQMLIDLENLIELDINPLIFGVDDFIYAVDTRMRLTK